MTKKKTKNKKKKASSLILLLFLTVIMLATATYAWFTANRTVKISDIDVQVAAKSGIQISSDATSWKTLLDNDDIKNGYSITNPSNSSETVSDKNMFTGVMEPVSTVGEIDASTHLMKMFTGNVTADSDGDFALTSEAITETATDSDAKFVAFDAFIKLDQASDIYLEAGSGVVGKASADVTKGLQYATRIAFVKQGNNSNSNAGEYAFASMLNADSSDVKILEPNYDGHTESGITQANAYYTDYTYLAGDTYAAGIANITAASSGNGKITYDGVKAPISSAIKLANTNATDNSSYFSNVTTTGLKNSFSQTSSTDDNILLYSNFPAGVTKIRIYMWVEGQDVDCENNASGSELIFKLSLTLEAPSGE